MTTIIELQELFKSGYCCEKDFISFVAALFCTDDITVEKNLDVTSGKVLYDTECLMTINHQKLIGNKTFKDIAVYLSGFCGTCRIRDEKGKELAFFTDTN